VYLVASINMTEAIVVGATNKYGSREIVQRPLRARRVDSENIKRFLGRLA
jgi:hypothetical protein